MADDDAFRDRMTSETEHLTESDLAGFLDRDLDAPARARVEAHLDGCAVCQAELANAVRLVDSFRVAGRREARPRRWGPLRIAAIGGALAAGLASVVLLRPMAPSGSDLTERRPLHGDDRAEIEPIAPLGTAGPGPVVFTWRQIAAGSYRLVVLAETGERLFTRETTDSLVVLPDSVGLEVGHNYFWRVDGIEGAIVASTGSIPFSISP